MEPRSRLHIFVLIDALGWKVLEEREFLSELLPYRKPLRTVLGFSSAAIPTILTGLLPQKNGHWNLFYLDPAGSPFRWLRHFDFLPDRVLDNRVSRRLFKEMGRRILGLGPLFDCCVSPKLLPFFNWVERRNIYDRGGIIGAPSIFDRLSEAGVPYRVYTYHKWRDDEILLQAQRDIEKRRAAFFFVYLSEMDMFLHMNCKDANQLDSRVVWYAGRLRDLFATAEKADPDATFTVVSDHGMTPVTEHFDLVRRVESAGFRMPDHYLAVYDSTMARFWFFNVQARQAIAELLHHQPCGKVLSDDEMKRLGIFFPDRRYGELIFLLHPGWLISHSDFNGPGWMPLGMHGYHPDDPYSDAVFLSNRRPSLEVRTIADVYNCMLEAVV